MQARLALAALIFAAFAWAAPASAYDIDEVRSELRKQGFDQLDFQRTKPPFKLDACRGGERFHLHVDFYGKITEQTPIGRCGEDAAAQPAAPEQAAAPPAPPPASAVQNEPSSIASPGLAAPGPVPASTQTQRPKQPRDAEAAPKETPARETCARYFPELGKALPVPCAE